MILAIFLLLPAFAHLADKTDLSVWTKSQEISVDVKKDGTSVSVLSKLIHIQNEAGRANESVQKIDFRPLNQKQELIEAYTLTNGRKIPVRKENISIESGGSNRPGFDPQDTLILAFPQVEVGSDIYYKIQIHNFSVPEPNFFSDFFLLSDEYLQSFRIRFDSELPLFTYFRNPKKQLDLKKSQKKDRYSIELSNSSPIVNAVIGEDKPYFDDESFGGLAVSTHQDWQSYAQRTIKELQKMSLEAIPIDFQTLARKVRRISDSAEQVNTLTSLIAEKVHFFGDWRRVRGDFLPRTLKEIHSSSYGDCKDLAFVTTLLLRQLGYQAEMAWVMRWNTPLSKDYYSLPTHGLFNHTVVRAEREGQIFWVDPTNLVSQSPYTPYDIAGRPAFMLSPEPRLEEIPPVASSDAKYESQSTIQSQRDRRVLLKGHYSALGLGAVYEWQTLWNYSDRDYDFKLISSIRPTAILREYQFSRIKERSRILAPFKRDYDASFDEFWVDSSAGYTLDLVMPTPIDTLFSLDREHRVSDLALGFPHQFRSQTTIRAQTLQGDRKFDCSVRSPWLDFERKVTSNGPDLEVKFTSIVHRQFIRNMEIKSPTFANFQKELRQCFSRRVLVFK